jgi:PhzF family phenazine biosynthesis protein
MSTLRTSAFKQIDVFTAVPTGGNPVAVILDAENISDADMQRIANWTNLSETTFVLPPTRPEADYRLRIFTPRSELPFAGHPSVGTAHALLESAWIKPKTHLIQECGAGLLPIRVESDGDERRIFVRAPRAKFTEFSEQDIATIGKALRYAAPFHSPVRQVDVGPKWVLCELHDEAAVRALDPNMDALISLQPQIDAIGFCVFGRAANADYAFAVRAFCPADGIPEDPVTGSANAAIGAYLLANGKLNASNARYRVSQGREVGRDGYVDVCVDISTGDVEIGGQSVTCVDGTIVLP